LIIKNKHIILIIFIGILTFSCYFYFILKDKIENVNDKNPYTDLINQTLESVNDAILIENDNYHFKDFDKALSTPSTIDTTLVEYIIIPKGSFFVFNNAIHLKNSVSGISSAFLLGEVRLKNPAEKYKIIYHWGTLKTLCVDGPCNYWVYSKGPWQNKKDNQKYFQ